MVLPSLLIFGALRHVVCYMLHWKKSDSEATLEYLFLSQEHFNLSEMTICLIFPKREGSWNNAWDLLGFCL